MVKIAIKINDDNRIGQAIDYPASLNQKIKDGWILVDNNQNITIENLINCTIRKSDNTLVHIATNQTPEEEKNAVITQLTLQNLSLSNDISDLKKLTTAQTLQSLQDAKDKSEQKEVITGLTKEILELKNNATTETK